MLTYTVSLDTLLTSALRLIIIPSSAAMISIFDYGWDEFLSEILWFNCQISWNGICREKWSSCQLRLRSHWKWVPGLSCCLTNCLSSKHDDPAPHSSHSALHLMKVSRSSKCKECQCQWRESPGLPRCLMNWMTKWLLEFQLCVALPLTAVLQQLQEGREQLEELWTARRLKLDLCLQLRLFEREALEVGINLGS